MMNGIKSKMEQKNLLKHLIEDWKLELNKILNQLGEPTDENSNEEELRKNELDNWMDKKKLSHFIYLCKQINEYILQDYTIKTTSPETPPINEDEFEEDIGEAPFEAEIEPEEKRKRFNDLNNKQKEEILNDLVKAYKEKGYSGYVMRIPSLGRKYDALLTKEDTLGKVQEKLLETETNPNL